MKRRNTILLISVAALAIGIHLVISWFGGRMLISSVNHHIIEKTEGLYSIQADNVTFNWFNGHLSIENLTVHFDSIKADRMLDRDSNIVLYQFSCKRASIQKLALLQWLHQNALQIDLLELRSPSLQTYGAISSAFDSQKEGGRHLLRAFSKIDINKIRLVDANLDLFDRLGVDVGVAHARQMDVEIDRLQVNDSLNQHQRAFKIDDFSVSLIDVKHDLDDQLHRVYVDTVKISLRQASIALRNINLKPYTTTSTKNTYSCKAKALDIMLKNFDINNLRNISATTVKLTEPILEYHQRQESTAVTIYELIKPSFDLISVDELFLQKASISLYENDTMRQQVKALNLGLYQFRLDSTIIQPHQDRPIRAFCADNFDLKGQNYTIHLPDNGHRFSIAQFHLSSTTNSVILNHIRLHTMENTVLRKDETLEVYIQYLMADQISLAQNNKHKILNINQLTIHKGDILNNQYRPNSTNKQRGAAVLGNIISDIFDRVVINKVQLKDIAFNYNDLTFSTKQGFVQTQLDAQLKDFNFDVTTFRTNHDQSFFSKYFDVTFRNYEFKSAKDAGIYSAKMIRLENYRNTARIEKFSLKTTDKALDNYDISTVLNIEAKYILIEDIDFAKAFYDRRIGIGRLTLDSPQFNITKYPNLVKRDWKNLDKEDIEGLFYTLLNYTSEIRVDAINIPNGKIHYTIHKASDGDTKINNEFAIQIEHLLFNEYEMRNPRWQFLFSQRAIFIVKNHLLDIGDGIHQLSGEEIIFDSDQNTLTIKNAHFFPVNKTHTVNTLYEATIPKLQIQHIDLQKLYLTDSLEIKSIVLDQAHISLYKQADNSEKKRINFKDFYIPLPKKLLKLDIASFKIKNSSVQIYKKNRELTGRFLINNDIDNFSLENKGLGVQTNLSVKNWHIDMQKAFFITHAKEHLNINKIVYDVQKGSATLTELSFNDRDRSKQVFIEAITLHDVDPIKLYNDDFEAAQINLIRPKVHLSAVKQGLNKKSTDFSSLNLYPFISQFFNRMHTPLMNVLEARVILPNFDQDHISITLNDVEIDKTPRPKTILYATSVQLNIKAWEKLSPNYRFSIDDIAWSSQDKQLTLNDIHLEPLFSKAEFNTYITTRIDRVECRIPSIKIIDIDLNKFIKDKMLYAKKAVVSPAYLDFYKDLSLPKTLVLKSLPQRLFSLLDISYAVDSLVLLPSKLHYEEYTGNTEKSTKVWLNSLTMVSTNATNIPEKLNSNPIFRADIDALLMGSGKIHVEVDVRLNSVQGAHTIKGSLSDFPLHLLDNITTDAIALSIRKGNLDKLYFEITADDRLATGMLNIEYDELNVALLNQEKNREKKFISSLINLILRNQTSDKKASKNNVIYWTRNPYQSFVSYWWHAIATGVKSSFGLRNKQIQLPTDYEEK